MDEGRAAASRPGLRAAAASECAALAREAQAQASLFGRHVRELVRSAPGGEPTMALTRARAFAARAQAAAYEVAAGRAFVYDQHVAIDVVREAESRGQEMVLLEGGTFQAVIFLDRRRHPDWAQAWDAYLPVRQREREMEATVSQMPGAKESTR